MNPLHKLFKALGTKEPVAEPIVVERIHPEPAELPEHTERPQQNLDVTQRVTLDFDPSLKLGPKVSMRFKAEKGLPSSQAEVDAIPEGRRATSYFTSRPMSIDSLVEVTVKIGAQDRQVAATKREAQLCRDGRIPRVRAFMINGKTIPWYEWSKYDPFKHYWAMDDRGWTGTNTIVPCLMKVEQCDPRLTGYYKS